ncbi:MAG: DUF1772 domain-containing protein [Nitrospira sp.]
MPAPPYTSISSSILPEWAAQLNWRRQASGPSYKHAAPLQVSLALIATSTGLFSWWMDGRVLWLIGALVIFAVIPFTLIAIMPTNQQLLNPALDRSSEATHRLLQKWGTLHAVRSFLSLAASCIFLLLVIRA